MQPLDNPFQEFRPLVECQVPDTYFGGTCYDVGGYVLGDPFDTMLRLLSTDYLAAAWRRLQPILRRHDIEPDDLSWGWLFTGETHIADLEMLAPSHYTGWITQDTDRFDFNVKYDERARFVQVSNELKYGQPSLRCAYASRRSAKWRIAPDDFPLALRLIEVLWSDDVVDWNPHTILGEHQRVNELIRKMWDAGEKRNQAEHTAYLEQIRMSHDLPEFWLPDPVPTPEPRHRAALAIATGNQEHLDHALAEARAAYSPIGYRILVRGFKRYLSQFDEDQVQVHMP